MFDLNGFSVGLLLVDVKLLFWWVVVIMVIGDMLLSVGWVIVEFVVKCVIKLLVIFKCMLKFGNSML